MQSKPNSQPCPHDFAMHEDYNDESDDFMAMVARSSMGNGNKMQIKQPEPVKEMMKAGVPKQNPMVVKNLNYY